MNNVHYHPHNFRANCVRNVHTSSTNSKIKENPVEITQLGSVRTFDFFDLSRWFVAFHL